MSTQSIPLAHPWDAGAVVPVELAAVPDGPVHWTLPGVQAGAYQGRQVWACFRGLALPVGATVTAATIAGWSLSGSHRWRLQLAADADPPGGMAAVETVLDELGTAAVVQEGLTAEQQDAVAYFWEAVTNFGARDPETPEGMAAIMGSVAWYYDWCIVQGLQAQPVNQMVAAFGPWATSWPYNWVGWTPAGGWDFDVPDLEAEEPSPELAPLLQELADFEDWQPGGAVLLLCSPVAGAAETAEVTLAETATPVLVVEWEGAA